MNSKFGRRIYWRIFFFKAEEGIRYGHVTGVQTCALPICGANSPERRASAGRVSIPGRSRASPGGSKEVRPAASAKIGRASCREQVLIECGAVLLEKK